MALTSEQRRVLRIALADKDIADAVSDMIDSGGNPVAANVAALGATVDVGTTDGSGGAGDAALAADVESRLDTIEAKIDAVIASLVAAGIMASS